MHNIHNIMFLSLNLLLVTILSYGFLFVTISVIIIEACYLISGSVIFSIQTTNMFCMYAIVLWVLIFGMLYFTLWKIEKKRNLTNNYKICNWIAFLMMIDLLLIISFFGFIVCRYIISFLMMVFT